MGPESEGQTMKMPYLKFGKKTVRAYFRHPMRNGHLITHRTGIGSTEIEDAAKCSAALAMFITDRRWHTTDKEVQEDAAKINKHAALAFWGSIDEIEPDIDCNPDAPELVTIENPLDGSMEIMPWKQVVQERNDYKRQCELERRNRQSLPSAVPVPWFDTVKTYLDHLRTKGGHKGHPANPLHVKNRESSLTWWAKILPDNLSLITPTLIEKGVQTAITNHGRGGAVMRLDALKPMLEYAVRLRLIKENPSKYVILKK
jgi:hypothetical protein